MPSNEATSFPPFTLPANLTIEQQVVMCVGQLVADWANCETLLRGTYVCLTGRFSREASDLAEITWLSFANSKARCDLLHRSATAAAIPADFRKELHRLLDRFKKISSARNFYCHAHYETNTSGKLIATEGYNLTYDDTIVHFDRRVADKTMVSSLCAVIANCDELNRQLSGLLVALHKLVQAQFPKLPEWPDDYLLTPKFLLPKTETERGKQQ